MLIWPVEDSGALQPAQRNKQNKPHLKQNGHGILHISENIETSALIWMDDCRVKYSLIF